MRGLLKAFITGKYKKHLKVFFLKDGLFIYNVDRIYYRYNIELKLKLFLYNLYKKWFLTNREKELKNYSISSAFNYIDRENTNSGKIVYKPVCDWCHREFSKEDIRITTESYQYHKSCFTNNIKKIMRHYPNKNLIVKLNYLEDINLIEV